jgi:hypothetical protein
VSDEPIVVDPITGEVVTLEYLAVIFANAWEQEREMTEDLRAIRAQMEAYEEEFRKHIKVEQRVEAGEGRHVVLVPPKRPAQRVSTSGCQRHKEELLDMKLGREELVYKPPLIGEVRANRAALVARGIPLSEIAPEPLAGPPTLEVVKG